MTGQRRGTRCTDWKQNANDVSVVIHQLEAEIAALGPQKPVNAQAAAVHMALEAATGFAAARPYLKRARINARYASGNEQAFVAAVVAWSHGDTAKALKLFRKLVEEQPTDIATAKWAQYHAFNLGDAQAMREIAETTAMQDYARLMSSAALELDHRAAQIESLNSQSLTGEAAIAPKAVAA